MKFLKLADLEMLVLNKQVWDSYALDFYERVITVTESDERWHDEELGDEYENVPWLFSNELLDWLWSAYPWNAEIHKRTDLFTVFSTWLEKLKKEIVVVHDSESLQLEPNIHGAYATKDYPELDQAWRNVLASQFGIKANQTVIISFDPKPNAVTLIDIENNTSQLFSLIKNESAWQEIVRDNDPWLKNNLPQSGDYPYQPPKSYYEHKLADFPTTSGRPKKGFIDHKDQYWEWHENENHWDVQFYPYRKDDYFSVSPDGRRLK